MIGKMFDYSFADLVTFPRIIMSISLIGVYFLNWRKSKKGFVFFAVSAMLWVIYDIRIGAIEQAATCLFSAIMSIMGYLKWRWDENKGG